MKKYEPKEAFFLLARTAITNSMNIDELLQPLSEYGYDLARLRQGEQILDEAIALDQKQNREYGEQYESESYIERMSRFGYSREKLLGEKSLVEKVREANARQEREKGEARAATQLRNRKYRELKKWFSEFKQIAFITFDQDRQQLEKMGFTGQ